LSKAGVRPDISERVLGHVIAGVEGIYDRRRCPVARQRARLHRHEIGEAGVLRPIRLNKNSPTAQVFFRAADVRALIAEATDEAR
jgi:hypothetical protein